MSNIWDTPQNENEPFYDNVDSYADATYVPDPALSQGRQDLRRAFSKPPVQTPEPQIEDLVEAVQEDEQDDDYSGILNDARLRLEQGRLYEMVLNNDIFQDMDVDPRAIRNVHREIKRFARERMEIMLGMRVEAVQQQAVVSPFNHLEIDILKKLASKATGGMTESPQADNVAEIVKTPSKQALTPIGKPAQRKLPQPAPMVVTKVRTPQKPLQQAPQRPIQRKPNPTIDAILREEGVPREAIEEDYKPLEKDPQSMTPQELAARNAERASRYRSAKSVGAIPMATPDQQAMLAQSQAMQVSSIPGMGAILKKFTT